MRHKISIFLVILLYMMIYNPPIFGFNCILVLMAPSIAYVLMNRKYLRSIIDRTKVITDEIICLSILTYGIIISMLNSNPITNFSHIVYWIVGDIPFSLSVWIYLYKKGKGVESLLQHIIAASLLMAATSILALLLPPIKDLFTKQMIAYGIAYADLLSAYRNYGFAANLTSTASMLQATLSIVCIYFGMVKKQKKYYLFALALAVSALINTRSSIVFISFGLIALLMTVFRGKKLKTLIKYLSVALVAIGIAIGGMEILGKYNQQTRDWINTGFNQIVSFISGEKIEMGEGYFGELNKMTTNVLPNGIYLLFGVGSGILGGGKYGVSSDVGFINDIWRGGIVYMITLIGLFMVMLKHIRKSNVIDKQEGFFLSILLFFAFILNNIKGSFFIHSDMTAVIWLLYIGIVCNRDNWNGYKIKIRL